MKLCGRQGSHDFIVDLGITHVPMRSGRHLFVLESSNPTVVTNVKLVPSPEADDVELLVPEALQGSLTANGTEKCSFLDLARRC